MQLANSNETDPNYDLCQSVFSTGQQPTDPMVLGMPFLRQWFTAYTMDPATLFPVTVEIAPAAPGPTYQSLY